MIDAAESEITDADVFAEGDFAANTVENAKISAADGAFSRIIAEIHVEFTA